MLKAAVRFILSILAFSIYAPLNAQQNTIENASLQNCINYALENQVKVKQSLADEEITNAAIKSRLADWYPQINFNYNFQHNFQLQTSIIGGNPVRFGVENTSTVQFAGTQTIFNRDVLLASRTKTEVRQQAKQNTQRSKIDVVADVSKAFYDVLTTEQQIHASNENILRLEKSLKDAESRYQAGLTDKTDFKRAMVALNNTKAQLQSYKVLLVARKENLKGQMNYPVEQPLEIVYDTAVMIAEVGLDTASYPTLFNRIEYQILTTQLSLQEANLQYSKWAYLPTLTANGAYNMLYLNNELKTLYQTMFPQSFAGINLSFPIFQGMKRKHNINQAAWNVRRTKMDLEQLTNAVNVEYNLALANYKSSMANFTTIHENRSLAQEVYDIIQLQYSSGIKTYLEVITAETDLRTAQINYFNALYAVLASKIDVQKALGTLY